MLDFPSLLYKGLRILMFQLSGVYSKKLLVLFVSFIPRMWAGKSRFTLANTRFLSSPFIIRVPLFLLFGFNRGTQEEKGKRVLLSNLEDVEEMRGFTDFGSRLQGIGKASES